MKLFSTFRSRLAVVLIFMLILTIGAQYYLNVLTQRDNDKQRERQERAIVAGFAVGISSLTNPVLRIQDLVATDDQPLLDARSRERIGDILVIDDSWQIFDALDPANAPYSDDAGNTHFKQLSELQELPPLRKDSRIGDDVQYFPNGNPSPEAIAANSDEAHVIPVETSKGRWYVMVVLHNDKLDVAARAAQPLKFLLGVLIVSGLITFLLVLGFTRPIAELSAAARKVAEGDLSIRVSENRYDEMGRLGANFNEMTAELEKNRELEAQLQQAEKSAVVGRLGSAIAHEIRNPLNYINLTLDHLRSKYAPPEADRKEKFDKLTSQLKAEVARINQQITDFLNYSRPATAKLVPLDARDVLSESLRIAEPQAAESGIKIGVIEHEDVPKILGDPEFLRSVFNNLFINAIQAMQNAQQNAADAAGTDNGHLTVKISPSDDGSSVIYEISDTGGGIPVDNLEKIFEPYFSTKETGTGLGLAIVKKVVDIHNGNIQVESEAGKGTKFTVKLPIAN